MSRQSFAPLFFKLSEGAMDSIYTSEILSLNIAVCDTPYRSKKIWDTCNIVSISESGRILDRYSFPQLQWQATWLAGKVCQWKLTTYNVDDQTATV